MPYFDSVTINDPATRADCLQRYILSQSYPVKQCPGIVDAADDDSVPLNDMTARGRGEFRHKIPASIPLLRPMTF